MADKLYKEEDVARVAGRINSHTGENKAYKLSEMADGVDEAAEAAAEEKEAVTRALIERSIEEIIIPEGVEEIGPFAFCSCSQVRYIDIPDGVTSIENQAFNGVGGAKGADGKGPDGEVIIPDSVKVLSTNAFLWSGVRKFIISKKINRIEANTFGGCGKCESYDFSRHESVPTLANVNAFDYMTTYKKAKIYVPPELYDEWVVATNWAEYAEFITYKASEGLEITRIDDWGNVQDYYTVKGIGSCTDSFIAIPSSYDDGVHGKARVADIERDAFNGNNTITGIYIPASIDGMGSYALCNCSSLKRIYMPGIIQISSFEFSNLPSLEYVEFGGNFESLGGGGFTGCSGVIYDFTNCTQVPRLDSYGPGLEFGEDPVIRVPAALYEEWKADTNWTNYADYIVAAE